MRQRKPKPSGAFAMTTAVIMAPSPRPTADHDGSPTTTMPRRHEDNRHDIVLITTTAARRQCNEDTTIVKLTERTRIPRQRHYKNINRAAPCGPPPWPQSRSWRNHHNIALSTTATPRRECHDDTTIVVLTERTPIPRHCLNEHTRRANLASPRLASPSRLDLKFGCVRLCSP